MLLRRLSVLLGLALWLNAASAAVPLPSPPSIPGSSHILVDFHTGEVLAEKNPDERVEPASITKVMTTYVIFKQLRSEEHTSELQSRENLVCRLLLEKKKKLAKQQR